MLLDQKDADRVLSPGCRAHFGTGCVVVQPSSEFQPMRALPGGQQLLALTRRIRIRIPCMSPTAARTFAECILEPPDDSTPNICRFITLSVVISSVCAMKRSSVLWNSGWHAPSGGLSSLIHLRRKAVDHSSIRANRRSITRQVTSHELSPCTSASIPSGATM